MAMAFQAKVTDIEGAKGLSTSRASHTVSVELGSSAIGRVEFSFPVRVLHTVDIREAARQKLVEFANEILANLSNQGTLG
jgi:hypothetical protein